MEKDHLAVSHKSNQRILRNEIDGLLQAVFELCQFFAGDGRVDHQQEDGFAWPLLGVWQDVFDGCEVLNELGRKLLLGDVVGIMRRERVLLLTCRAQPSFESEVDHAEWVQNSRTLWTGNCLILHECHVFNLLERSVKTAHRADYARC